MSSQVNISRRYYTTLDRLWGAIAEGFLLIYTGAVKEKTIQEFRPGGKIHVEWGANLGGGTMDGEYLAIEPQSKLAFSWKTEADGPTSTVTITILQHAKYCELTLVHDFPVATDVTDYDFGWDDALFDLKKHVYRNEESEA